MLVLRLGLHKSKGDMRFLTLLQCSGLTRGRCRISGGVDRSGGGGRASWVEAPVEEGRGVGARLSNGDEAEALPCHL
jgi:hypothetical protein